MRNMSFMLTTRQVIDRSKTVTRRMGWPGLAPGTLLWAVEKGMGLRPGEKVVRLALIRVVDVRGEPLRRMTDDPDYGIAECAREGFCADPVLRWPTAFVPFFCGSHRGCTPETVVNRIAFEYVDPLVMP